LGRPKSNPELVAAEKQQFIDDQRQRNAVEGKIGQGKQRYGLGLIREKLAVTQGSTIAINVLIMNLQKLLELLFVLFVSWLYLLLSNQAGKESRLMCLNTQPSPA
jgi:IS5 family transposase